MTTSNDSVTTDSICTTSKDDSMESASITKGYWFYFQDGDNEIAAYGSGWSGKEIIFFNDNPVSEERSYRFTNEHVFTKNGKEYRIVFHMVHYWTGELHCSLYIDGVLVDEQKKATIVKGSKTVWITILIFFVIGMVSGYIGAKVAISLL